MTSAKAPYLLQCLYCLFTEYSFSYWGFFPLFNNLTEATGFSSNLALFFYFTWLFTPSASSSLFQKYTLPKPPGSPGIRYVHVVPALHVIPTAASADHRFWEICSWIAHRD